MVALSWPLPRWDEVRLAGVCLMHEHMREVFAAQLIVNFTPLTVHESSMQSAGTGVALLMLLSLHSVHLYPTLRLSPYEA